MTDYPPEAIQPIYDEHGRMFVALYPAPGVLYVPLNAAELVEMSKAWAQAAADALTMGQKEKWSHAEERAGLFLQRARELDPNVSVRGEDFTGYANWGSA